MCRFCGSRLLFPVVIAVLALPCLVFAQEPTTQDSASQPPANSTSSQSPAPAASAVPGLADPIPANAPKMSQQTRYELIHDFQTQVVYARTLFPMGAQGLLLKGGTLNPNGEELKESLALWGPSIKPGDPVQISWIQIKGDHIHLDLNGGPVRRKKWYERVQVSGSAPVMVTPGARPDNPRANVHGSFLDIYFDKYVPEMNAQQLRDLLFPALDFNARSKEQAYLDTMQPIVKQAILEHRVLVGMDTEMVVHAKGKPPKKVRERDGDQIYEEWIYGEAPADVDFVRIIGDEVVRVETMKVGGQKIVRTDREVVLPDHDKNKEAKKEDADQPAANAPSLRRPGENTEDVPQPSGQDAQPSMPVPPPPPPPPPPHDPNMIVAVG